MIYTLHSVAHNKDTAFTVSAVVVYSSDGTAVIGVRCTLMQTG